jgi:LysR family transcriptional regulator, glycine cleavage system transcriptional activator
MRRLPHLNGVKAFEAAARCGSFAGAAAEMNVSAAAVSRLVRLLEGRLGVDLFERGANRLALTPQGRMYQVGLSPLFDALAQLTEQVRGQAASRVLTIGVGPTFAVRWLIPRLESFRRTAPNIDVRITTGGAAAPFADDWTCGIKLGDGKWSGLVAERLFDADLTPVCTPRLAQRLRSPRTLKPQSLLRVAHAREDWPLWFKAAGLTGMHAAGPMFEFYGQALQAAADGVGVSLGIRPYIDDDLKAGRLVAPLKVAVSKGSGWYLIFKSARSEDAAFVAFRRWIHKAVEAAPAGAKREHGP